MAIPPYAKLLVSLNGGAPRSGRIRAMAGDLVTIVPESSAAWRQQLWEIYSYPEGWTAPAGWTLRTDGSIASTSPAPLSFSLPPSGPLWGKWLLRLTVNEGRRAGAYDPFLVDESTGLSVASPAGLFDLASLEGVQFDARRAWVGDHQANLRLLDAAIASAQQVGWAGDLAGSTNQSQRVSGLQGVPLASTAPAAGNLLAFDGTRWTPVALPHVVNLGVWKNTNGGLYESFTQTTFANATNAVLRLLNVAVADILAIDLFIQAAVTHGAGGWLRLAVEDSAGTTALPETEVAIMSAATQPVSVPVRYDTRSGGNHRVIVQGRMNQAGGALELRYGATLRVLHVRPS